MHPGDTQPLVPAEPTVDAPALSIPPAALRFCPACGATWRPEWTACPRCASVQTARESALAGDRAERHPLRAPLVLYFAMLATSFAAVIGSAIVGESAGELHLYLQWGVQVVDALIVLVAVALLWRTCRSSLRSIGRWFWYPGAALAGLLTFLITSLLLRTLTGRLEIESSDGLGPLWDAGFGWMAAVLTIAVQPAIIEELAFRGIMLPAFARIMPTGAAIAVSSVMFMVLHLMPLAFPHLLLIGLILGGLRVASGSVYPGIILHFTHNLLVAIDQAYPII